MPNRLTRYLPAIIICLAIVYLVFLWTGEDNNRQFLYMYSAGAIVAGMVALAIWARIYGVLSHRAWVRVGIGAIVLIIAASASLRVRGVTGNMVPILAWRWSADDFGTVKSSEIGGNVLVADYPRFLGPSGNATLEGPDMLDWTDHPPREIWRINVGEGWSAFSVSGRVAVTQEQRGDEECVVAYDLLTGTERWVHRDRARYETTLGGTGPRATPTIWQGRVYTVGAFGRLNCLDLNDGALIWTRNLVEEHDAKVPEWGFAGSPLVTEGTVIVGAGGRNERSLVAYDALDGTYLWGAGTGRAGYSTPARHRIAGRDQILIFNQGSVAGHDAVDGSVLWQVPWEMPGGNQCVAQPLLLGPDRVFVTTGYGVGCKLYEISDTGDGFTTRIVYETPRMKAKFTQVVLHEGYIYGLDDGVMVCLDPENGQRKWKAGRYGHGQILLVGSKLIVQTEDGDVILVQPNPDRLTELGSIPAFDSKTWNNPILAGSLLIVRNDREAVCYRVAIASDQQI